MESLRVAGLDVQPGTVRKTEIDLGNLPTGAPLPVPIIVAHGKRPGPRLFLTGCLHGDEVIGIDIIRRVIERTDVRELAGSIVAAPIVNVFGLVQGSRYLPDRRDLNRSFPGSPKGSLAARLAHVLLTDIIGGCTHGIDLHTGSGHRTNFPHVRTDLSDPARLALAQSFGTSLIVDAHTRDGSLRDAMTKRGIPCLVYEAGEANRFDRHAVESGIAGVERVMRYLKMGNGVPQPPPVPPRIVTETRWVRARRAGILGLEVDVGDTVSKGDPLGTIRDGLGERVAVIKAPVDAVVLGLTRAPLVHRGDGLAHLAE